MPRGPPNCGGSRRWRRWCWRGRWRCSYVAKLLLPLHPAFGFVAAFAEAATIGGLADWYAVVALFKRPRACRSRTPPSSRATSTASPTSSASSSRCIFLKRAPVEAKLRQIDFGSFIADWLRDRRARRRRPRPLHAAAAAGGGQHHGNLGSDEFHHPPHHRAIAIDRSGAARRRHAARLRGGWQASGVARRSPARDASNADPA